MTQDQIKAAVRQSVNLEDAHDRHNCPPERPNKARDRQASVRLLLPHPAHWTVNEAKEARECSGYCTVRYERGIRMVTVPRPCPAHGSRGAV